MSSHAFVITPGHARRFMVRALGLSQPFADVAAAIAHHGFVQIDPINVCGRMHDLMLRNRVSGYREGDLLRHLHGGEPPATLAPHERGSFEHYLGVLAALPVDAWPFLLGEMRANAKSAREWWGRLSAREEKLAEQILAIIATQGPISSDDIEHDDRALTAWNSHARMAKVVLEKLFIHGRVLISARRHFRRVYDLPERVLPARVLNAPPAPAEEATRWRVEMKLRQLRLARLRRQDLAMVADIVQPLRLDHGATVYCLREDAPLLDETSTAPSPETITPIRLLAPLDPLIYDRELARRVWDFDYTWEVYTPPAKRKRGYYALPVLAGHSIAGHVDPKADREAGRLSVISRRVQRGVPTTNAIKELAKFLGLKGR